MNFNDPKHSIKTLRTALFLLLIFLPPICLGYLVSISSVNVPHWDEWEFIVPIFQKIEAGSPINFNLLWSESGDHVILIPRVLMLIIGELTNLNFSILHWSNLFFVGLTFLLILTAVIQEDSFSSEAKLFVILIISIIQFSLEPVGVYLWGMSLYIYVTLFLFALCALILSRPSMTFWGMAIIILANAVALLTSTNGLALVVLSTAICLLKGRETKLLQWWIVGVVSLAELISMIIFLSGRTLGININLFSHGPIEFFKYVLVYLGSNYDLNNVDLAMWYGSVMLGIFGIYLGFVFQRFLKGGINRLTASEQFFVFLGILSIVTAILTAIGREGAYGVRQALTDRYIPFAHFLTVSLVYGLARVAFTCVCGDCRPNKSFFNFLGGYKKTIGLVFLIVLFVDSMMNSLNMTNINTFKRYNDERELARVALLHAPKLDKVDRASLEAIYPGGYDPMSSRVEFLKMKRMGPFFEASE